MKTRKSVTRSEVDTRHVSSSKDNDVKVPSFLEQLLSKEYVTVDHVPEQYKERFLTRGYRQPYSSFLDCLVSVCRPTNETLNIWTHLLPLVYLIHYFRRTFPCQVWPLSQMDPHYYPLLAEELSALAYLLGSVVAHTFNCMTPRIRHICFFLDYTAISMFGAGGTCSTFYYLRPLGVDAFFLYLPNVYIGLSCLCNILAMYLCCASRHKWESSKFVIRTLAFTLPFITGNFPSYYRILNCVITGQECTSSLLYIFFGSIAYLFAAMFNSLRFPERKFPSTFDICGHSHQWFHILTTVGTVCHFWAVHLELEAREDQMEKLLEGITFNSSLGWTIGTLAVTLSVAMWFGSKLTKEGNLRTASKDKPQ